MVKLISKFISVVIILCIVMTVTAFSSYAGTPYQNIVDSADSLQVKGDFNGAIKQFEIAEQECLKSDGFYCDNMRYIIGSIAACAQELADYDKYLSCLKRLDDIGSKIGYDEEISEAVLCAELAKGLLWSGASEEDLETAKQYLERGSAKNTDDTLKPHLDLLYHILNYISASKLTDLEKAASILEYEYHYLLNDCNLPQEVISNVILECGLLWSTNQLNRQHDKECLDILKEINDRLKLVVPDFYSLDLEVLQLEALVNLGRFDECISASKRILSSTIEDDATSGLLCTVKYHLGRSYNRLDQFQDALDILQSIYSSPFSCQLEDAANSLVKLEIATALAGLKRDKESESICMDLLQQNPQGSILTGVYWLLSGLANRTGSKLEIGFIDDFVSAYDNMGYEDLTCAETFLNFSYQYAGFRLHKRALEMINRALDMFEKRGDSNSLNYYVALFFKLRQSLLLGDFTTATECYQKLGSEMDTITTIMKGSEDYESSTYMSDMLISTMYTFLGVINYNLQVAIRGNDNDATAEQISQAKLMIDLVKQQSTQLIESLDNDVISWLLSNNPDRLGRLYHSSALVYSDLNEYDTCLEYVNKALSILPRSCTMYSVLTELRDYQYMRKDGPEKHIDFIIKKFENDKVYLRELFNNLSATRRSEMWSQFYGNINNYIEYAHIGKNNPRLNEIAYDAILLTKGILLQTEIDFTSRIFRTNDKSLIDKYNLWTNLVNENSEEAGKLERDIIRSLNSDFDSDLFKTSWRDVRDSLAGNEYAVEFRAYDSYGEKKYIAFIVGSTYSSPISVEICSSNDLQNIGVDNDFDYHALSKLIWSRLGNVIPQSSKVYFSLDMQLHALPLENLPDFEYADKLICDRWDMCRVSSTRELTGVRRSASNNNVEIFGGMDYFIDAKELLSDYRSNSVNYRTISLDSDNNRGSIASVRQLPGSKREVSQIKDLLSGNKSKCFDYTGQKATESCFKAFAGKKGNILHISTHGFYISSSENNYLSSILGLNNGYNTYEDAMLHSGLMMAGVNETILGRVKTSECEDGLLTAKEIAGLNLNNTDFVILSACETGVGAISGEGVFGLQRGFKLAGTKSIMMSLWKVDDNATERLMVEFYKNWLKTNNAHISLTKAQESIRNTPGWEAPQYWAGFILLDSLN